MSHELRARDGFDRRLTRVVLPCEAYDPIDLGESIDVYIERAERGELECRPDDQQLVPLGVSGAHGERERGELGRIEGTCTEGPGPSARSIFLARVGALPCLVHAERGDARE